MSKIFPELTMFDEHHVYDTDDGKPPPLPADFSHR